MRRILLFAVCAVAGFALAQTAFTATTTTTVLAYNDLNGSAYVTSVAGTSPTTAFDSSQSSGVIVLGLSPDGKSVLVDDGTQLDLVPAAGGSLAPISGTGGATSGSFSPDGTTIVFSTTTGISTIPVGGGTATQIIATPDSDIDSLPTYAPSGKTIAFARDAFDADDNETITLELAPSTGGTVTDLAASPYTDASSGGRIAFSPDGKTIAYTGDDGIYTIPAAGGSAHQLTTEDDSAPAWSADGTKLYFSRSAFSPGADDQQPTPVSPNQNDIAELWSMNADGSGAAVIQEGDYENVTAVGVKSTTGSTSKGSTSGTTTTKGGTTTTGTTVTSTAPKATGKVTTISVSISGVHYKVTWKGSTSSRWKVVLKVGKKSVSATVKGSVRSHTFTVKTKGVVTASVAPAA
ncbi:MAG TPA: hypothetical protein VHV52_04355 [Gaiellaceae bacterium]|nr:hypothetical protein [Gaiellaceae bacterium]